MLSSHVPRLLATTMIAAALVSSAAAQLAGITIYGQLDTSFRGTSDTLSFATEEPNGIALQTFFPQPIGGEALSYGRLTLTKESGNVTMIDGYASEDVSPGYDAQNHPLYPTATAFVSTSLSLDQSGIYSYSFYGPGSITIDGHVTTFAPNYAPPSGITWSGYLPASTSIALVTSYHEDGNDYGGAGRQSEFIFRYVSPVPEPSSLAAVGFGAIGLCWRRKQR